MNESQSDTHTRGDEKLDVPTRLLLSVACASVNVDDIDSHKEIAERTHAKQNQMGSKEANFILSLVLNSVQRSGGLF